MLNVLDNTGIVPSDAQRSKMAYIYVRQSSISQLRHHQESTQLQYRLVERAIALGWPRERVYVIDDDLGKSGTRSAERPGFRKLIAEIGLGHTGLAISFDASRLARNNTDWHQLLDLCSLFGVLIADGERLYDPCAYHDRLLLGLSGIMSEAELHQIKTRLHQGERQKAARGELRLPLPAGLAHDHSGATILNPDEEVQARIAFVFIKFRELRSARAVLRYLRRERLPLPVRPLSGPAPHAVIWREASNARILAILHNPAYAGAYVYGRRQSVRGHSGLAANGVKTAKVPLEEWEVCLQDAHPGYISWQEFMENQKQLTDNNNRLAAGAPRSGSALLQGIALCGRCGRRMSVRYSGPQGDRPVYCCRADKDNDAGPLCQEVRAYSLDPQIAYILLEALAPDRIDIAVAALEEIDTHKRQLERQWALRRERARYEAERARRQYDAVEPENRLVARSLEKAWEDKLRAAEAVEQDYQHWRQDEPVELAEQDYQALQEMAENLPAIWTSASTTWADRKSILRLVIKDVILDAKRKVGEVWFRIIWQTGVASEHCYRRPVQSYDNHADRDKLRQRIVELSRQGKMDKQIAAELNADNFISARGMPFNSDAVFLLRKRWGIACAMINGVGFNPRQWPDKTYYVKTSDLFVRDEKMIEMAFDSIESNIDRRWVPAAQSFEQARMGILTIIRFLTGERSTIKRAMRECWLESEACAAAYGIALEVFHVLDGLNYRPATRLFKALKSHAAIHKARAPENLFKFAAPEKAAALIHSENRADYARTYATLEFGRDLSGTIDLETARDVLTRHEALWFVYPDATYHVHLIREGIWLDITLPQGVVDELRTETVFAALIRLAELDAQGLR